MKEVIIRNINASDYESIVSNVINEMSVEEFNNYINNNNGSDSKWYYFVSEIGSDICGIMFFEVNNNFSKTHIARMDKALISNKHQGKGIFKTMLNYANDYLKSFGIEMIVTGVRKRCIAETVYQRIGFVNCGELPNGFKNEGNTYTDEVYYYYNIK